MSFIRSKARIFLLLILIVSFLAVKVQADDTDCSDLSGDAKDQCKSLEKKAQVYQDLIDLKDKQQDTLASQLDNINNEQESNQAKIKELEVILTQVDQRMNDLQRDIDSKQSVLDTQKAILSGIMQSYYDYDQQGVLPLVLLDQDFSDTFNQTDYLEQTGVKMNDILSEVEKAKNDLVSDQDELQQKKDYSEKLKGQLSDRNSNLQASENQKQSLLSQTQGEEAKYQDLLARVEQQKQELFNFSEASNTGEVSASVDSYPKPKDHLASTSWYFSQKDSRWGNMRIGNSSSLMKDYGCAVTAVSMVFRKLGSSINPGNMAKQKIFYYDLIKWPTTWSPGIDLTSSISHGNISWSKIDAQIKKGNPVIVYIGKTNGKGGHYVVITGKDDKDYIVHDPYFGANLYLGTSKALVGKIGVDSGVKVDQMIIYN